MWELMERFKAGELFDLHTFMTSVASGVRNCRVPEYKFRADQFDLVQEKATRYHALIAELGLQVTAHWANQIVIFLSKCRREGDLFIIHGSDLLHLAAALGEITNNLGVEVSTISFFRVPPDRIAYFNPNIPLFGQDVADRFPNNINDMFEVGNCFALGRNTACVFHLMRIMESATQVFGNKLDIQLTGELNWQEILNRLNPVIKKMDHKQEFTKQVAAIQAHLYNVKIAWRNEVMHPKATYDEEEARILINSVRAFLIDLIAII